LAQAGLELGDVGHPLGLGFQRGEVALQQVAHARRRERWPAALTTPLGPRPALQAIGRHQPRHPVQAGCLAFFGQVFVHATGPQRAPAVFVQLTDPAEQTLVVALSGAGQALAPVVVAAGRHSQAAAHQSHWKLIAATFDHLIPQDDPLAKNVAASRKKSRSFFTRASSRLRRASSSSRGVPAPPKATLPWLWASRFQRVNSVSRIPSSRATWAQLTPGWLACSTAPRLNSALNFLRFDMNT